jgi:phospholipid/cholesterol/gamma-HCH transport system substrate-binding protein
LVFLLALVLLSGGSAYVVTAQFSDAGQLVGGDVVTVAGHQVGTVGSITLTNNGLADVKLDITDSSITPIGDHTLATIGQLSLTGVANRFVGLDLGGGAPIPSGGTLPVAQTRGIVDLDQVLDDLNPQVRSSLQQILKTGGYLVQGSTPKDLNRLAQYLNPALSQTAQLSAQIASNNYALDRLVATAAQISTALSAHTSQLQGAVSSSAQVLSEIAARRSNLQDAIARAPAVLDQSVKVLRDTSTTLTVVNPVLRELEPVAPQIAQLLRVLTPVAKNAIPTVNGVEALVPGARKALDETPGIARRATPAVTSLTAALKTAMPLLEGFRAYMPDAIAGFFEGFGGSAGGYYDANGHYSRVEPVLAGNAAGLQGGLSLLGAVLQANPFTSGYRTGLLARCPGSGSPPGTAGGNPWDAPDTPPNICNPADDPSSK